MKNRILYCAIFLFVLSVKAQWTDNGPNLTTSDNVGIGLNPYGIFNVKGGTSTTSYLNGMAVYNNAGTAIRSALSVTSDDHGRINLYNSSTHLKVFINSLGSSFFNGGNVGIGTTNPQHKMEVYGSNNAIGIGLTNYGWANTNLIGAEYGTWDNGRTNAAGTYFYRWTGSATSYHVGYIGQEINNGHWGLAFKTDSKNSRTHATSTRMFIDTNGDVGIGTTDPNGWKLAVNGNIHTKEVKVDLVGWPDYVFDKDYTLPTLEEVENHIKELGHLKDIPSAEDVTQNGIFLGEMEAKLLRKIEELTLYTIQQQKEIENLKQENKELKSLSLRLTQIEKLLRSKD